MKINSTAPDYKGFRFPPEIISHAVWLSFRFSLSFRDVEEFLAQRGIVVTYETVRQWCLKFGQTYANEVRRRRPRCGDKWHLDEVFLAIRGKKHGSGSFQEDAPFQIVAMKKQVQTSHVHKLRFGERESFANKTTKALSKRTIPALYMRCFTCFLAYLGKLLFWNDCLISTPKI